jgi:transcription-repair coupling factor (superfamily II helicase)
MMEVGFQLYNEMLSEAVRALKSGQEPDLLSPTGVFGANTEVNLHAPALLPDSYCADVHVRLSLYKRLASVDSAQKIDTLLEELVDRFGKPPAQTQTLFDVHRLRVLAKPYGVVKIDAGPAAINIHFRPNPPVDPMRIIELVQKNRQVKLAGNDKLRVEKGYPEVRDRVQYVRDVLRALGQPVTAST